MRFNKVLMSSAVVLSAFSAAPAMAAGPTLSEVLGNSGITTSGTVDVSYDWARNDSLDGSSGEDVVRQFDLENDGFSLHQVNLTVGKTFADGIGATVNVLMGDDAEIVGNNGDEFDLTQAYLSKTHGNLTVIAGKFVTLAGMEVINSAGNLNASRSLLFFNQPLVHEGVRASYKLNDLLSVSLGLSNMQNASSTSDDNNTDQTIEAQIALTPMKNLSVFLTGYTGNEDPGTPGADADLRKDTIDLVVNFGLSDTIYLGLNADYFNTEDMLPLGGSTEVHGVAGYAQIKLTPKLRVAVRSEYLDIGREDYLRENTLTLAHACSDNLEILLEGRHDKVTGDVAPEIFAPISGGALAFEDDQYTGTIKAIYKF